MWIEGCDELKNFAKIFDFLIVDGFCGEADGFFGRNSFIIRKDDGKTKISIEKVQEIIGLSRTANRVRQVFVIENAEDLSESAANAFLKLLEEPNGNNAFVFLTSDLGGILPTVKSRATIFRIKPEQDLAMEMQGFADEEKKMAKLLIAGGSYEVVKIANILAKESKDGAGGRDKAKRVLLIALKMLEKMMSDGPKAAWVDKIEKIETALRDLTKNLNVRLVILSLA